MMDNQFSWNSNISNILIKGLNVTSIGGLLVAMLCVASLSFLFEWFKYIQVKQRQFEISLRSKQLRLVCRSESAAHLTSQTNTANPLNITPIFRLCFFSAKLGVWFVLTNIAYCMMLIIMVFNGWLFISAIIGGGIGYFLFGQMFMKINIENCRIIRETFCATPCDQQDSIPSVGDGESTPALQTPSTSRDSPPACHVDVHAESR